MEHNTHTHGIGNQQLSPEQGKVQRLSREGVEASASKWCILLYAEEDIVRSCAKGARNYRACIANTP